MEGGEGCFERVFCGCASCPFCPSSAVNFGAHPPSSPHATSENAEAFRNDLFNIARTTLSSKILTQAKDYFSNLAVDATLRIKKSGNLEAIQIIKKLGGQLRDSYLEEGFLLDKKIGVNQPKRIENAKILIANTSMDTDKIKVRPRIGESCARAEDLKGTP